MDPLKEAFSKIKEDILFLTRELAEIKESINLINQNKQIFLEEGPTDINKDPSKTLRQTDNPLDPLSKKSDLEPLYSKKGQFSKGNKGVSTDRQTIRQTIRQTETPANIHNSVPQNENEEILTKLSNIHQKTKKMVNSLTSQELVVLCKIYELDGQEPITYSLLSSKLNLTESSIRDYITRLLKKEAPLVKKKINNKQIEISLVKDTKVLVPLTTLIGLRK